MSIRIEWKPLLIILAVFLGFYFLPLDSPIFSNAVNEALMLARDYAREHVIFCLVPAFFIAGGIGVFLSRESVMNYLGAGANKVVAYAVASVSGCILAVCSCTVLPLFAGICRMGAGLGPATTFLYSGPAINVLAIILTARVLGPEMGIARAVGAIVFSVVIGLAMHYMFRREELDKAAAQAAVVGAEPARPLWRNGLYFAAMVLILVFANWGKPVESTGAWHALYSAKWAITGGIGILFGLMLIAWFGIAWWKILTSAVPVVILVVLFPGIPALPFIAAIIGLSVITSTAKGEMNEWFGTTWGFAKQILPLLFFGVLIAGALLGRPNHEGLIPSSWISNSVGGNSLFANLFASVAGAFMYFATLTEVPILQGLIGNGMGKGPALALLLAGPALSLPNMLVIRSVIGTKKTVAFVSLVVVMATIAGLIYGAIFG
jgi:uncharacterized membrane protein YraQ (UPF0718 family)